MEKTAVVLNAGEKFFDLTKVKNGSLLMVGGHEGEDTRTRKRQAPQFTPNAVLINDLVRRPILDKTSDGGAATAAQTTQ